jgi:hypothetical protein
MRKLLIALLAVALVLCGASLALVAPRHCSVNRAACDRIKEGMTRAEVEQILGGPPGDYRTRPGPAVPSTFVSAPARLFYCHEEWRGDGVALWVNFDDRGRVAGLGGWSVASESPGPIAIARWRLNRLLGRESD